MKEALSDWCKRPKQDFSIQYAKKLIKEGRIDPMPEKDPVSGWWLVEHNAKVIKP